MDIGSFPTENEKNIILQNALVNNYLKQNGLLTSEQIGKELFEEWEKIINKLFLLADTIQKTDWKNNHQLKKAAENTDFWALIPKIYDDFIGPVNGLYIYNDSNFLLKTILYTVYRNDFSEKNNLNNIQSFRLNFEFFTARKILEQMRKTPRELLDEQEELRKWRRLKTKRKKSNQKKDDFQDEDNEFFKTTDSKFTYLDTVYVYKEKTYCHISQHPIKSATAILLGKYDKAIELNVEHCTQCNKLYMNYTVYENYKKRYGVLIGNIKFENAKKTNFNDFLLSEHSPLKLCGYTVGQQESLSAQNRQYIISKIIDLKILTKEEVIHYLEHFIKMNGQKKGNEIALKKWEEDLKFTLQYKMSEQCKFRIKSIEKLIKKQNT